MEKPNSHTVYYAYHQTSVFSKTTRSAENIEADHGRYKPVTNEDTPDTVHSASDIEDFNEIEPPAAHAEIGLAESTTEHPNNETNHGPIDEDDEPVCKGLCNFVDPSRAGLFPSTVECIICAYRFHEECVGEIVAPGFLCGIDKFTCKDCFGDIGKNFLLNEYILVALGKSKRCYPCRIVDRISSTAVKVEWYPGNIYKLKTLAKHLPESLSPEACIAAYFTGSGWNRPQTQMGSIKWPIQLIADAHDNHGYENRAIQLALEDAFYSVSQIVHGQRDHPVMSLYCTWRLQSAPRQRGKLIESAQREFDEICRFKQMFDINILPGDESLVQPFIADLDIALRPLKDESIR
ncbi:hypothetical protein CPC08DRAFT_771263 [Agrocybe pediades]|nr:hypothetical protein CPC08DRAFT_771263 [Agrocybe pediades]